MSVYVAIVALAVAVPLLGWAVLVKDPVRAETLHNLRRGLTTQATPTAATVEAEPGRVAELARRLLPRATTRLERMLARAGRPAGWTIERALVAKLVLPTITVAVGLIYLEAAASGTALLLVVLVVVVSAFVPELLLHSRGIERSQQIALELADVLDQVSMAVEAGLPFDAAMARVGRTGTGPLADEIRRTQLDMQMGQSRRRAYQGLAERSRVPALGKFVRAVLQADVYGVPVADVLRTQAADARVKRRQQAEEKAMQIPTKVVFPLMLFIMPVMFIVLLGPAALDIINTLT